MALFSRVFQAGWPVLTLFCVLPSGAFQARVQYAAPVCEVSDARQRPAYIEKLMQQLVAVDESRRQMDALPPEAERFLRIVRADPPPGRRLRD